MTFLELAHQRRSCRSYDTERPVEREKIERCLEAARVAPSATNGQPWRYVVVTDPGLRERVARATFDPVVSFNRFSLQAPVLVVLVIEPTRIHTRAYGLLTRRPLDRIDIGITAAHFCLEAVDQGLGCCMLGWFNPASIRRHLGIPRNRTIGLVITLGYPAKGWDPPPRPRKRMEHVRSYDRY